MLLHRNDSSTSALPWRSRCLVCATRRRCLTTAAALFGVVLGAALQAPAIAQPPAESAAARTVTLVADGQTHTVSTHAATVGDLLHEQQIRLNDLDRCSAPLSTPLLAIRNSQPIVVTRVAMRKYHERHVLPFAVKQRYSRTLPVGTTQVLQPGQEGARIKQFIEVRKNGHIAYRKKVGESVSRPQTRVVVIGAQRRSQLASRSSLLTAGIWAGRRMLTMNATGYYGPRCGGSGITAIGLRARRGIVAVDRRLIPLGTRLFIEGYGHALAGDTGGAIKGLRIDLAFNSYGEAVRYGRKRIRVIILD